MCVLTAQSIREQADKAFANKNYHQASILYDQWVKALPNDYYSHIQLATSYIYIKNNHKAALTLCTAINAGLQEEILVQDTLFTPLFIHFDKDFLLMFIVINIASSNFMVPIVPKTNFL